MEYEYTVLNPLHNIKYVKHVDQPCLYNDVGGWWCAYVTLDNITREEYPNETYREGNTVGVDTNHIYNEHYTMDEKFEDAKRQIHKVIEAHEKRMEEIKGIFMFREFIRNYGKEQVSNLLHHSYKNDDRIVKMAEDLYEMFTELDKTLWADPGKYYFGEEW